LLVGAINETSRILLVLFGIQNRTFVCYLSAASPCLGGREGCLFPRSSWHPLRGFLAEACKLVVGNMAHNV
jgi:hypothetical protein